MRWFSILFLSLLTGCAATTSMVLLDPSKHYAPAANVEILLRAPQRPYDEIAKLESHGLIGEPEPDLLEDARAKAAAIGADAIIVVETTRVYEPPVVYTDPWPPYLPWYQDRWHGYYDRYFVWPYAYFPEPMSLPGGDVTTIRSIAIKYR